jgi:penicillin amidase
MSRSRTILAAGAIALVAAMPAASFAARSDAHSLGVVGLRAPVQVVRDSLGVPNVFATSDHDVYLTLGYLHAQDRLFQMDTLRRQASGTLAELLGPDALASDVPLRTLGLRRAAERSLAALSPESLAMLDAYAAGVNAWLAANPLPLEYGVLELTKSQVPAWTPLDTEAIVKLIAFGVSFESSELENTQRLVAYQTAGAALGFSGVGLFFEDVMRSEPFAHTPSILPGESSQALRTRGRRSWANADVSEPTQAAARKALEKLRAAGLTDAQAIGSNLWVISGGKSESGHPLIASDPHLALGSPPLTYQVGLDVSGAPEERLSLHGATFPGAPFVVFGTNGPVSWGATINPSDVTDFYAEQLVLAGGVPVATTYLGETEPLVVVPETFRANQPGNGSADDVVVVPPGGGIPPATLVVPRRNQGPLLAVEGVAGISVQFTGFSPTRDSDFFRLLSRARTVGEAIAAQRFSDTPTNWMYVDDRGNIGYQTSGEIPLREDLQAETVAGLPPFLLRNGTGGNEWIADPSPADAQALSFQILPAAEMDGLVNPARGWISNANQDPTGATFDNDPLNQLRPGGGIRYITSGHVTTAGGDDGIRNTRIGERLQEALADGAASLAEMQSIQADVVLGDAKVLVPQITAAFQAASTPGAPPELAALAADPEVQEAVERLTDWDFTTPTGIAEGYDAADPNGARAAPTDAEVEASVAATIYSLWRSRALALIVDQPLVARGLAGFLPPGDEAMVALRHLLEGAGTGASGIVFFDGPVGRDTAVLTALRDALDLAASPAFAPAFAGSTNPADYRWGRVHRVVFPHPFGGPFSIPTGAGFADLAPGLPGIPTDGGFGTIDAAAHDPRAGSPNDFMFDEGPVWRFVAEARPTQPTAAAIIPGGASGNPAGPWFGNQLGLWLTNDYRELKTTRGDAERDAALRQQFVPEP